MHIAYGGCNNKFIVITKTGLEVKNPSAVIISLHSIENSPLSCFQHKILKLI